MNKYTVAEKMKIMEFVYANTDSFIMNTFGWLWESRGWWEDKNAYLDIFWDIGTKEIAALHAFYLDEKLGRVKTYYIVVRKDRRGQGLAAELTKISLEHFLSYTAKPLNYYVNSDQNSPGVKLYSKYLGDPMSTKTNEFGSVDLEWRLPLWSAVERFGVKA